MAKKTATASSKAMKTLAITAEDQTKMEALLAQITKLNRAPLKTAEPIKEKIAAVKKTATKEKEPKAETQITMDGKMTKEQKKRLAEIHEAAKILSTEAAGIIRESKDLAALEEHRKFEACLWNRFAYTKRQITE